MLIIFNATDSIIASPNRFKVLARAQAAVRRLRRRFENTPRATTSPPGASG